MSDFYSDDDDFDVHVRSSRRHASPPYNYVEAPRERPVSYFAADRQAGAYLVPGRTVVRTRSRSRERFRQPNSPQSPPAPASHPVIINNNRFYHERSDDEDDYRQLQVVPPRQRSLSRSRPTADLISRQEFEAERLRRELEEMKLNQLRDEDERRAQKQSRDEAELRRAKRELDEIRAREEREKEEERIKRELVLERLKEEEREKELKKQREEEAQAAVERYKQQERERMAREEREAAEREKEYQRRLQEDLIQSGLDEKHITAILKKEKVPENPAPAPAPAAPPAEMSRQTYTRMARKHLSIETLRTFHIEYDLDIDPDYVLIKRWVPNWEQDTLWNHTRDLREKRSSRLLLEVGDKRRGRDDTKFEWVRKKSDRKRSKSPALLMYLAGARPA
ncbi:hypothetical protein ACRALDRAFT_2027737 [Sodiomyces alcalophilus JCM 7366]|uniref:uncharacterized protein n=1 Tax=Sodiomyces alcalophilus JCM 7366 TaxID=591952 RepID=UPI0039B5ADC2